MISRLVYVIRRHRWWRVVGIVWIVLTVVAPGAAYAAKATGIGG